MYLYFNRSWATTNHSARSIHIILLKEIERMIIVNGNYQIEGYLRMHKRIIACPLSAHYLALSLNPTSGHKSYAAVVCEKGTFCVY